MTRFIIADNEAEQREKEAAMKAAKDVSDLTGDVLKSIVEGRERQEREYRKAREERIRQDASRYLNARNVTFSEDGNTAYIDGKAVSTSDIESALEDLARKKVLIPFSWNS